MQQKSELPEGWVYTQLRDVTLDVKNVKPENEPDRDFKYIDISSVDNCRFVISEYKEFKGRDAPSRARRPIKTNDVLFSNVRTYLKNIAIVGEEYDNQLCSTGFTVLRPSIGVSPKYLFIFVQTDKFIDSVTPQQRGSQYPATSDTVVRAAEIPLPPLPEQHRIVAAIEALFARLDATNERLDRVPEIMKAFRQAVLAAACDGRLTEEWRGQQVNLPNAHDLLDNIKQEWDEFAKATGKKIKPLEPSHDERIADLPTLPQEWTWIRVKEISSNIVDCLHSTAKFVSSGYYCIDTTCVENSRICFDKARFVSEETYLDRIRRLKPTEGDILFSREGTVGTTVIVPKNVDLCLGQRMMMFRPLQSVIPKYFMYYFQSTLFLNQYKPLIGGTTSPHLNIKDVIQLHFPICSLPEQQEIVRRVDALFAFADSVEAKVAAAREKTERLRQSILAKAFSGELVPTEAGIARQEGREYESAGELLERVKKEGRLLRD